MIHLDSQQRELDRLFDALSHPYRRRVLVELREAGTHGSAELHPEDLATGRDDPDRLRAELYHNHLPKLERAGYVNWDRDTQSIRPGPRFETVESLIALVEEHREELPARWP